MRISTQCKADKTVLTSSRCKGKTQQSISASNAKPQQSTPLTVQSRTGRWLAVSIAKHGKTICNRKACRASSAKQNERVHTSNQICRTLTRWWRASKYQGVSLRMSISATKTEHTSHQDRANQPLMVTHSTEHRAEEDGAYQ